MSEIIQRKIVSLTDITTKDSSEHPGGEISGLASVFDVVDLQGEIVRAGAFRETVKNFKPAKGLPLLDNHRLFGGVDAVAGKVFELRETSKGLFFRAFFATDAASQSIRTKIKDGILDSLSIGFNVVKRKVRSDGIVELLTLSLREVSIVFLPANPSAVISGVKGDDKGTTPAETAPLRGLYDEADWKHDIEELAAERGKAQEADRRHAYEHIFEPY